MADDSPPPTDFHLRRWRDGDEEAFAALHARFTPILRARVRNSASWPLLSRHCQVEDVLNEFWTHALPAARERFASRGEGSLLGFLGEILDRKVIDLARRQGAQKRGHGNVQRLATGFDAPDRGGPERSTPATPTSNARHSEFVSRVRELLPACDFELWHRIRLLGHSAEEVAAQVGKTGSAVRGSLFRAEAKIATALVGSGPDD